jgi:hypothetical protein
MNPLRSSLVDAIRSGIASRDFYIVPAAEQISGRSGNREKKLECVRQFARDNGWHLTIHRGNGWLLFTANGHKAPKVRADDIEKSIELSLSRNGARILKAHSP